MNWVSVKNQPLPKDRVFLGLWKGAFSICQYDEEDNHFYLCFSPANMVGIMKVAQEREGKFTHWCELEYPKEYGEIEPISKSTCVFKRFGTLSMEKINDS